MQSTLPATPTGRPLTMATRAMVAAPHYLAAEAGIWALQQGGNAIDGAVAAGLALSVVGPHMACLGGDALFMLWTPGHERPICLNGSGYSGYQATIEGYRDRGHEAIPLRGVLAANTVPGAVAAWGDVHARWGALPWDQLLEPAIGLAERGFPVSARLAAALARHRSALEHYDTTRAVFFPGGRPLAEGDVLVQSDLAQTLRTLADDGPEAFYQGDLAGELVSFVEGRGGLLTQEDLEDHHSDWAGALGSAYRGHTLFEFPPNSEGVAALFTLSLLAGLDVRSMGDGTARYYHVLAEAGKVTVADLAGRIGDLNHVPLPLDELLSEAYVAKRRELIRPEHARTLAEYAMGALLLGQPCPAVPAAGQATGYIAATDESGLTVSLIQSLHAEFGAGVVAGRTGVLLNNAGASFSLNEEHPNHLAPHKRPALPLMPAMLFAGGRPWLAFGASGGENEAQVQAALVTRVVDFGYNIQQAIEAPRWLLLPGSDTQPSTLHIEGQVSDAVLRQLREMGHDVTVAEDWCDRVGQAQAIAIDPVRGVFCGGADPRGDGAAIGW